MIVVRFHALFKECFLIVGRRFCAGSSDASPSLGEDCSLRQNQNRLDFFPLFSFGPEFVVMDERVGRADCGSILHTACKLFSL